jgi:hypothetical protein
VALPPPLTQETPGNWNNVFITEWTYIAFLLAVTTVLSYSPFLVILIVK